MSESRNIIVNTLKDKAVLKQDVAEKTFDAFSVLKEALQELITDLKGELSFDKRVKIEFIDKSPFEAHIQIAGDTLVFHRHTNIFRFDSGHNLWETDYLKEDENRAYCGIINVYNFLSDSFKYNRMNDSGYLIARLFVNNESHYSVEGKRQLGFLYNDFVNAVVNKEHLKAVVESTILYSMDFDLYTPQYDRVKEVSLMQMTELSSSLSMKTGKRLGYRFQADNDEIF